MRSVNHFFCIIYLNILSYCCSYASPPLLLDSFYEVREADVLGTTIKAALFSFTFDQPLAVVEGGACPPIECNIPVTEPCFCDYTNSTGSCGISNCVNQTCFNDLCDKSIHPWVDIDVGQSIRGSVALDEITHYRFLIKESCKAYWITLEQISGTPNLFVTLNKPVDLQNNLWRRTGGFYELYQQICPSDPRYELGTYFIGVHGVTPSDYIIRIKEVPLYPPETVITPTCQVPSDLENTHQCMEDSVPIERTCLEPELHYYVYNLTSCQNLTIHLSNYGSGTDIDMYISVDEYPFPYFEEMTWESYTNSDEYIIAYQCPDPVKGYSLIYTVIDCWLLGLDYANYTFYVSSKMGYSWNYRPLTTIEPYHTAFQLEGSAYLTLNDNTKIYCDNYKFNCAQLWMAAASHDTSPFWPLIPELRSLGPFNNLYGPFELATQILPNTFMVAVLLDLSNDVSINQKVNQAQLDGSRISFFGKLSNLQGEFITESYTARKREISCDYSAYKEVSDITDALTTRLQSISDPQAIRNTRFQSGLYKFRRGWVGCAFLLKELLISSAEKEIRVTRDCVELFGTPAYDSDPCCSSVANWENTCLPRPTNVTVINFETNNILVEQNCRNPQCIFSFLGDYEQTSKLSYEGCSSSNLEEDDLYVASYYTRFRACKETLNPIECYHDSDCANLVLFDNATYSCNLINHRCLISREVQEKQFLSCLVNQMDNSQKSFIRRAFSLPSSSNAVLTDELLRILREDYRDCIRPFDSLNVGVRSHFDYLLTDRFCAQIGSCPKPECEDKTCLFEEHACILFCLTHGASWFPDPSSESTCLSEYACNWNKEHCIHDDQDCLNQCNGSGNEYFCGVCEDGENCIEVHGIADSSTCENSVACLLPNETVVTGLSESECQAFGECNSHCVTCSSSTDINNQGVCYTTLVTSDQCNNSSGTWNVTTGTCIYPYASSTECEEQGGTFAQCSSLTVNQCIECQYNSSCLYIHQAYMQCYLRNIHCTSQEQCESFGKCSNYEKLVHNFFRPGACVVPRIVPEGYYGGVAPIPFCTVQQTAYPLGCVDYSYNKSSCESNGYKWMIPSFSKSECEEEHACYDRIRVMNQFTFSPKTREGCESEFTQGTWKPLFSWKPSRWIVGTLRRPLWKLRQAHPINQWNNTIDIYRLSELFLDAGQVKLGFRSKSEALCKQTTVAETLKMISCDCSSRNTLDDNCFAETKAIPVGQVEACSEAASSVGSPSAMLYFSNTSIPQECITVFLSQVSASLFEEAEPIRLSSNFAQFKKRDSFAVTNEAGATIGTLLSDGTEIRLTGRATDVTLCFRLRDDLASNSKAFPTFDFARSDATLSTLTPIEIQTTQDQNNQTVCAVLQNLDGAISYTYFPIKRIDNWRREEASLFDSSDLGLIYTLASLFLLNTVLATVEISLDIYRYFMKKKEIGSKLRLHFLLVTTIWLFNLVRSIYFFLLPRDIQDPAVDYLLVVLPTFFFFTAFTVIISLWAVVVVKRMAPDVKLFAQTLRRVFLSINLVLYLIFVMVVLLFHFTEPKYEPICGGRVASPLDYATQQAISYVYASIIALLSLALGIGFVYYGLLFYKQSSNASNRRKRSMRKLFSVVGVGSIGFILHCIFVIVLIALQTPNIVFSFVGLIITELLPSAFILVAFHKGPNSESSTTTDNNKTGSSSTAVDLHELDTETTQ